MVIHFAKHPQPDDRAHNGPALCGAGSVYNRDAAYNRLIIGLWDVVTCLRCLRMRDAYNRRDAREEAIAERHRATDPHCTCPDCLLHFAKQMEYEP
jgi:hypothetical protein